MYDHISSTLIRNLNFDWKKKSDEILTLIEKKKWYKCLLALQFFIFLMYSPVESHIIIIWGTKTI